MNKQQSIHSYWVVGFALFSMFFGSGNLMFPLFIGQVAESAQASYWGFALTGVLLPFLGVCTMLSLDGISRRFFAIFGKKGALLLTAIVLCTWIPFGSGPRCIVLAYSSLAGAVNMPPDWVFIPVYSLIVAVVCMRQSWFVQVLGTYLTPAFLLCIWMIIGCGLWQNPNYSQSFESAQESFKLGLMQGYNTQDLIAALFFSASLFAKMGESDPHARRIKVLKASFVGMGLLAAVYFGLVLLASSYSEIIQGVPKEQLLAHLGLHILGPSLGFVSAAAIALACISTSIALCQVFADFLRELMHDPRKKTKGFALFLSALASSVLAFGGLDTIMAVCSPLLQVLYPVLIAVMLMHLYRKWRQGKNAQMMKI